MQVLIRTDKVQFDAVEPVTLSVTLRNTASRATAVVKQNPHVSYTIAVTYQDGVATPLTRYGKQISSNLEGGGVIRLVLEPNAVDEDVIHLNRIFDMSLPGMYQVRLCRKVRSPSAPGETETIVSNTIEIIVR